MDGTQTINGESWNTWYSAYDGGLLVVQKATEGYKAGTHSTSSINLNEGLRLVSNGVAGHEWYNWHGEATLVPSRPK